MADKKSKRGLASADEKTRQEVARKGGESSQGGRPSEQSRGASTEQQAKAGSQSHKNK